MTQNYANPKRSIEHFWIDPEWLNNRMLFLSGPRQVGKTTLAKAGLCQEEGSYFNWDDRKVRLAYQKDSDFFVHTTSPWICFDEIHKRSKWKDILKGAYDTHKDQFKFLITGSARLETFKKSGDSLLGRYFHTHLFPLNLSDFSKDDFDLPEDPIALVTKAADVKDAPEMENLLNFSGFPEPYLKAAPNFLRRWSEQHFDLILTEDVRDVTKVVAIDKIEHLLQMLVPNVCQPLSYSHFAQDLETSHSNIKRWLEMLHKVHLVFPVPSYSQKIRRAYKQEKKWYFMEWTAAQNNVFENYVACSLLRAVTLYNDRFGAKMSLHFVRTFDGAEVDFLICRNKKPWLLIEAKEGKPDISRSVYRFSQELNVPCIVVTRQKNVFKKMNCREGQKVYCLSWAKLGRVLA